MDINIVDAISRDLPLRDLGEIARKVMSEIYKKLDDEEGIYNPICIVKSLGREPYNVDMRFVSGQSQNEGVYYGDMYCL